MEICFLECKLLLFWTAFSAVLFWFTGNIFEISCKSKKRSAENNPLQGVLFRQKETYNIKVFGIFRFYLVIKDGCNSNKDKHLCCFFMEKIDKFGLDYKNYMLEITEKVTFLLTKIKSSNRMADVVAMNRKLRRIYEQ